MFDSQSDYALNKRDPEAIVCKSVTGVHIRLTREDFSSEEEFLFWKEWSNEDYHTEEKAGRHFYDNCSQLIEAVDTPNPSAEDTLLAPILEAEDRELRAAKLEQVKTHLTEKQYRRLWMYYIEGMTEAEIAVKEGVGQPRVSYSLAAGKRIAEKFFLKFLRNRG